MLGAYVSSQQLSMLCFNRFPGCNIGNDLKAIAKVEFQ